MRIGIKGANFRADLFDPLQVFAREPLVHVLPRNRRDQPDSSAKKKRVGEIDSAVFLSRHGMSGKKPSANALPINRFCSRDNCGFCTSYIGYKRAGRQPATQ